MKLHMLFASFIALLFVTVNLPSSGVPAVPDGWQTYTNPLGFSIRYPANWSQLELPQQTGETIHTAALQGPEGEIDLHWGIGFGGACPQGYTTVKVAQGELPACYTKRANGTEIWAQIGKQLAATSFSADAHTSNAARPAMISSCEFLSTLSFLAPGAKRGRPDAADAHRAERPGRSQPIELQLEPGGSRAGVRGTARRPEPACGSTTRRAGARECSSIPPRAPTTLM